MLIGGSSGPLSFELEHENVIILKAKMGMKDLRRFICMIINWGTNIQTNIFYNGIIYIEFNES